MAYMVEVASIKLTFNSPLNQLFKTSKNVAPKVAPKNVRLVRSFCNVPERSLLVQGIGCPFSPTNRTAKRSLFFTGH